MSVEKALIKLTIDNREVEVPKGTTVLRAAESTGIFIPTLCDHPELTPYGGCRLCMVEVEGMRVPAASCTLPVSQGMVIHTNTNKLKASRQFILTMLFSERNHFCPFCQVSGGDCELQNAAYYEGMTYWPFQPSWQEFPLDTTHPDFVLDNNRCILCRRCVRACEELIGNNTLSISERGSRSMLVADSGLPLGVSTCVSCGTCVQVCPTGALIDRKSAYLGHKEQMQITHSICVGCSVGCGIEVHTRDGQLVSINGDWQSPLNSGVLCQHGRYEPLKESRHRLHSPLVRRDSKLQEASWDEALAEILKQLKSLNGQRQTGIAALISTRLPAEALASFKALFASHLHSDIVTSIEEGMPTRGLAAFADQKKAPYEGHLEDIKNADCCLVIGANLADHHQVAGFFVKRNVRRGAKLIVVNPCDNELDILADAIIRPPKGSDAQTIQTLTTAYQQALSNGPTHPQKNPTNPLDSAAHCLVQAQKIAIIFGKGIAASADHKVFEALESLAKAINTSNKQASLISIKGEANSLAASQYRLDQPFNLNGHQIAYLALGDDYPTDRLLHRFENAPFKVVQASHASRLTEVADIVLPVTTWAEQEGHYVNLDGHIQKTELLLPVPPNSWTDAQVFEALATGLGVKINVDWKAELFQRVSPVQISTSESILV